MKLKDGFVLREVAGEYVVLPAGEGLDLNMMITLNETGSLLWKKLTEGAEVEDLVNAILAEYDTDADTAAKSVEAFVAKLKEHNFLEN